MVNCAYLKAYVLQRSVLHGKSYCFIIIIWPYLFTMTLSFFHWVVYKSETEVTWTTVGFLLSTTRMLNNVFFSSKSSWFVESFRCFTSALRFFTEKYKKGHNNLNFSLSACFNICGYIMEFSRFVGANFDISGETSPSMQVTIYHW